jgi:ParB family transcriptional regulator, chromosome partitioning protein
MSRPKLNTDKAAARSQDTDSITELKQRVADRQVFLSLETIRDRPDGDSRGLNSTHVNALIDSIAVLGLITPLTVDRNNRLLAGGHRRAALQLLEQEQPERYAELFPEGVPVRRMDLDAEVDQIDALQIEVEENTQRRNYTAAEIREAARKLESAGYERLRGRPRPEQKSLKRELQAVFRLSESRIQRILNDSDQKGRRALTFSDNLLKLYRLADKVSKEIDAPPATQELQQLHRDISRLVQSLRQAIATLPD